MAGAADQGLRGLDEGAGGRAQPGEPVIADADDAEPLLHAVGLPHSALTAAAASALPPRRPLSVTKARPRPNPASASFASAAPTKPTGKPRISAGLSAPASSISMRWKSAVGALPIATTDPARCTRH